MVLTYEVAGHLSFDSSDIYTTPEPYLHALIQIIGVIGEGHCEILNYFLLSRNSLKIIITIHPSQFIPLLSRRSVINSRHFPMLDAASLHGVYYEIRAPHLYSFSPEHFLLRLNQPNADSNSAFYVI